MGIVMAVVVVVVMIRVVKSSGVVIQGQRILNIDSLLSLFGAVAGSLG